MITPRSINAMLRQEWPAAQCICREVGPTYAVASLTPDAADERPGGYISGLTLFAVADAALWLLCFGAFGRIERLALTSDLTIRFLRPEPTFSPEPEVAHAHLSLCPWPGHGFFPTQRSETHLS